MNGQKIYFQPQIKTSNNFLQNNYINNNLSTNSTSTSTTNTDQPIVLNDVNGDFGLLGNMLTNNYGLFLQSYLPTSSLSLNYGIVAESAGNPFILTQHYSMIPTNKNSNIYNV
jgi:hypothetical protein